MSLFGIGYDAESDEYAYDDDYDDSEGDCTHCGGDGERECDDWIQCMGSHTGPKIGPFYCACIACGGSGRAEDQRIW